jgi:hypothetical protein
MPVPSVPGVSPRRITRGNGAHGPGPVFQAAAAGPQAGKFALLARIDIRARQRCRAGCVVDPSGAGSHSVARRKGSLVYLTTYRVCECTLGRSGSGAVRATGRCATGAAATEEAVRTRGITRPVLGAGNTPLLRSQQLGKGHELGSTPFYREVGRGSETPSTRSVAAWRRSYGNKPDRRTGRQPVRRTTRCSWPGVCRCTECPEINASQFEALTRLYSNVFNGNQSNKFGPKNLPSIRKIR